MNLNPPQQRGFALPGREETARPTSSFSNWMPLPGFLATEFRNHVVAMCAEFVGTFFFLLFAFAGTQAASIERQNADMPTLPQNSTLTQQLYISLCFGSSFAVTAWVFFRISGGLFNPAVAFGMSLIGALSWVRGGLLIASQILGGIAAAGVVLALFPGPLNVRTSLGGGTSTVQGLFIEMFLTAQLVFTILMLAAEKHKATYISPVGIGLSLFVAELTGVYYTGGSVNPARSFGPCVVLRSFNHYHWIYWIGPILGTLLASGFYKFIKMLEYETANPSQNMNEREMLQFNPNQNNSTPIVNFPAAEPPVVAMHAKGSSSGYTDTNNSSMDPIGVPDRYGATSTAEQIHRQSATKASTRTSTVSPSEEPMGHIYIESSRSYQRESNGAKYVPRTAGRS